MINPLKPTRTQPKPPNPDELLIGVCGTCKARLEVIRAETVKARANSGFGDLPSAECPLCKARVYLMSSGRTVDGPILETPSPSTPSSTVTTPTTDGPAPIPIPQEDGPGKGIVERMMEAIRKGEDLEISPEEDAELTRLYNLMDETDDVDILMDD